MPPTSKGALREVDLLVIERVFEMSGGWVLGLSDAKFAKLMAEHSVDINDPAYLVDGDSNSKAKRFRRFLSAAEPELIADVLAGLLDYRLSANPQGLDPADLDRMQKLIERLRGARSVPAPQSERMQNRVDVAVITILPEEYEAVIACLDEHTFVRGTTEQPNVYSWEVGSIVSGDDRYRVAVALAGDPTNEIGAVTTLATIERFAPRYVALVGVAGGLAAEGQDRGDVVVSKVIYAYEYGKIDGGFLPRSDFTHRVDIALANAAQAYIATGDQWWKSIKAQPPHAKAQCGVRVGAVASGNKVIDDVTDDFFKVVMKAWPKLLAVEMEGAGAATAIESARALGKQVGFVMVRGISDMPGTSGGGTTERDGWKRYAAEAAARFFVALVRKRWPVQPLQVGAGELTPKSGANPGAQAENWRVEKRDTKQAEVAGEVLVAALQFLDGLTSITSIVVRTRQAAEAAEDPDSRHAWRTEIEARWDEFATISNRFVDAIHLAETYLDDEVDDLLKRVWEERASIKASQVTYFATPMRAAVEFFKAGFGSAPEKRLAALRDECRRVLRPIARLG